MENIFLDIPKQCKFTGNIKDDAIKLLKHYGLENVAEHSIKVANESGKLAKRYGYYEEDACLAGYLHDLGNIIPTDKRLEFCNTFGIEVLEEERSALSLLHGKISKEMAVQLFGIGNGGILNAVECHSTLRANPTKLDLILFVADKISWDIEHNQCFINDMIRGLEESLELGAFAYIDYQFKHKEQMKIIHPLIKEAYDELSGTSAEL